MEEYQPSRITDGKRVSIDIKDASFSWGFRVQQDKKVIASRKKLEVEQDDEATITNVNFNVTSGDLVVIVGQVGSGKTTLLHSIMNETRIREGVCDVQGTIAYVEQEPFIFSASIKENILLGKIYDEELFNEALQCSSLINDIKEFSNGADTVIGERGVNISGGQKARISLARAVYSEADVYLLDDPLSAVDP